MTTLEKQSTSPSDINLFTLQVVSDLEGKTPRSHVVIDHGDGITEMSGVRVRFYPYPAALASPSTGIIGSIYSHRDYDLNYGYERRGIGTAAYLLGAQLFPTLRWSSDAKDGQHAALALRARLHRLDPYTWQDKRCVVCAKLNSDFGKRHDEGDPTIPWDFDWWRMATPDSFDGRQHAAPQPREFEMTPVLRIATGHRERLNLVPNVDLDAVERLIR